MVPAVLLMGLGPLVPWKKASGAELMRRVRWSFAGAVALGLALPVALGGWSPLVALGLVLAAWVISSVILQLRVRIAEAAGGGSVWERLKRQSRSYYGMHLAHLGVAVFIIGVTMVGGYQVERDVKMEVGDTVSIGTHTFRFDGVKEVPGPNYTAARGDVTVFRNGTQVEVLHPEKRAYLSGMPMTEAAIDTTPWRDLYVSLGEPVGESAWAVRVYEKPFVVWIWAGCVLMALGGLLAVSDRRYRIALRRTREEVSGGAPVSSALGGGGR
jgi:cytochrome c-type biogenesis protein CcmF